MIVGASVSEDEIKCCTTSYQRGPSAQILISLALKSRVSWSIVERSNFEVEIVRSDVNGIMECNLLYSRVVESFLVCFEEVSRALALM